MVVSSSTPLFHWQFQGVAPVEARRQKWM